MDSDDLWKLILLVMCLVLSAFFSSSETAFIALPRARLIHLLHIGRPKAALVDRMVKRPEKLLATVLLSNNLVNTAAASLGTALALSLITDETVAVLVATAAVTLLLLIFSESLPKTIAWNRSETVAFAFARPLSIVAIVLSPPIRALQGVTYLFTKLLRVNYSTSELSEEEIRSLIAVGAQSGVVEPAEAELLEKVFRFGDQQIQEIMTPRTEIVSVEQGTTLEQFLKLYSQHSHSRFPVYEGEIENVVGVLSNKDVLLALGRGNLQPEDSATDLLREAYFVPETKTVGSTFSEMRLNGYGLVLTVDEFGGISGVVTLKKMLEVIVGQVGDEGNLPEEEYTSLGENSFRVNAGMSVLEANQKMNLKLPEGEYQTVAGFLLDRLGYIPESGEILEYRDWTFTIRRMNGVRIEEVEIQLSSDVLERAL
jgi:putative hemolysin